MADAIRNSDLHTALLSAVPVLLEVRSNFDTVRQVTVDGDGFLIGRGDFCDLQLDDVTQPLVHSELHLQGQTVWIEAADDNDAVVVNGDRCRRMALHDGDRVQCGGTEITFHIGSHAGTAEAFPHSQFADDLALLSASELCDRIADEETQIAAFERGQLSGWHSLLQSVEATLLDDGRALDHPRLESAVAELRSLSDLIASRTQQLAEHEAEFLESTSDLEDAQAAIARRIEQLLQGFGESELRASA
jgi:hypothetical protein